MSLFKKLIREVTVTCLDPNKVYILQVDLKDMSKEDQIVYLTKFKNALEQKGVHRFIIAPKNGQIGEMTFINTGEDVNSYIE